MADEWEALPDAAQTPAARVNDTWDALPDAHSTQSVVGASAPVASPGFYDAIHEHVEPVLNAFGEGAREGWGPERWGMSPDDVKWGAKVGLFAPEGATRYQNPFQAMNELLGETIARTWQVAARGGTALYRGAQSAGVEAGLPKDIVSLPDAFMGSPHPMGIPKALPEVAARTSLQQLSAGERLPTMSDTLRARELGVVGEERAPLEGAPAEAAAQAIQPTVAYHGSPHDFAAFSTDHIGTGEGAQSYGHGMYFAENPGVADSYRHGALEIVERPDGFMGGPQRFDLVNIDGVIEDSFPTRAAAEKELGGGGNMYRVRINADRDRFLDWDKPLGEQSAQVRGAIEKAFGEKLRGGSLPDLKWQEQGGRYTLSDNLAVIEKRAGGYWLQSDALEKTFPTLEAAKRAGEDKVKLSHEGDQNYQARLTGSGLLSQLERELGRAGASDSLRDAGIPGIKYLDQGSRPTFDIVERPEGYRAYAGEPRPFELHSSAGDIVGRFKTRAEVEAAQREAEAAKTSNFVVFNDKDVEITHKNGAPVEPTMSDQGAPQQRIAAASRTPDDVLRGPQPGEAPKASGNPWQDRFDHFVDKIETGDDVKQLIRDAATDNSGFTAARQGEIPLGHVEALAEAAGVAPDTVDRTGAGRLMKNDAQVRVGMQTMLQASEAVRDAARAVKADASPEALIKLQETMMRRDLAVEQIVGLRAEWGRTGGVFQEFMRDVKDQDTLTSFLKDKTGRTPGDLRDIADALDTLDRNQTARVLSDMHSKAPGAFYWTWVNGLISGLFTHAKYVAANALYAGTEHGVVTPIAAMIGKAKQVFGADVERVYFGEAAAGPYGMIAAVPGAISATAKSVWQGKRAVLKSELDLHADAVARGEKVSPIIDRAVNQVTGQGRPTGKLLGVVPLDGIWGRIIGAPGDMAGGIHSFFKILGERAGIEARAYRAAADEGLSPADSAFWDRRAELAANPTLEMKAGAVADAYKGTFMGELGPRGRAWQKFTKETPGLKWIFPFSHIPLNLMKATYESTPLALMDGEMRDSITGKNGGVAQDKAIARMVVGSTVMGYFVNQALNGRATGDYPLDPKERDSWKLQGKQPNSIMIGGYWVSFNKFGPAGDLANLGANLGYIIPILQSHDDEAMTKATFHLAVAAARIATDEVGFQSLANMFEAARDENKGKAWAASTAASFLPFSSLLGQTASFMDPDMRQAKTFIDGIKYKIPGERETLLPKRDTWGMPLPNPQYHNVIRQRLANVDPVNAEMDRLQIHPGLPQDRIGGVKLTAPLYDEYQVVAGTYAHTALDHLVSQPGWQDMPPYVRSNMIHANITMARKSAEALMQARHPELIGQGIQQRQDFITGRTSTPRPKVAPEAALQ